MKKRNIWLIGTIFVLTCFVYIFFKNGFNPKVINKKYGNTLSKVIKNNDIEL